MMIDVLPSGPPRHFLASRGDHLVAPPTQGPRQSSGFSKRPGPVGTHEDDGVGRQNRGEQARGIPAQIDKSFKVTVDGIGKQTDLLLRKVDGRRWLIERQGKRNNRGENQDDFCVEARSQVHGTLQCDSRFFKSGEQNVDTESAGVFE
jgi:hypothetical protein